jgi:hypothetical protein
LLNERQAAAILGTTPDCLRNARASGVGSLAGLTWLKLGEGLRSPVRYEPAALRAFIARRRCGHRPPEDAEAG